MKCNGWRWYHFLAIPVLLAAFVGAGYMGEYKVQRTAQYVRCYLWQSGSLLLLLLDEIIIYRTCVAKEYDWEDEE